MTLLFDSDVLIDLLRGNQKTGLQVERLNDEADSVQCSVITVAEILAGMRKNETAVTENLLKGLIKVDINEEIARLAGKLKMTKGHHLFMDDCLIAASAFLMGAQLVTKNAKHYPFSELKVHKII